MLTILLDGKNARHVSKPDIRLVFQDKSQPVEVTRLVVASRTGRTEHAVPLIDDKDKRGARACEYIAELVGHRNAGSIGKGIGIGPAQVRFDCPIKVAEHRNYIATARRKKVLHVEMQDIIGVKVPLEARVRCN